jgi:hypothetical protein
VGDIEEEVFVVRHDSRAAVGQLRTVRRARQVLASPFPTFAALLLAGVCCVPRVIEALAIAEREHYILPTLGCCALAPLVAGVLAVRDARWNGALAALGALLLVGGAGLWVFLVGGVIRAFAGVGGP